MPSSSTDASCVVGTVLEHKDDTALPVLCVRVSEGTGGRDVALLAGEFGKEARVRGEESEDEASSASAALGGGEGRSGTGEIGGDERPPLEREVKLRLRLKTLRSSVRLRWALLVVLCASGGEETLVRSGRGAVGDTDSGSDARDGTDCTELWLRNAGTGGVTFIRGVVAVAEPALLGRRGARLGMTTPSRASAWREKTGAAVAVIQWASALPGGCCGTAGGRAHGGGEGFPSLREPGCESDSERVRGWPTCEPAAVVESEERAESEELVRERE